MVKFWKMSLNRVFLGVVCPVSGFGKQTKIGKSGFRPMRSAVRQAARLVTISALA
jgi:hypothetical protein